jgi:hypothetical protein
MDYQLLKYRSPTVKNEKKNNTMPSQQNQKIMKTDKDPNTHMYDRTLFCLRVGTSKKVAGYGPSLK